MKYEIEKHTNTSSFFKEDEYIPITIIFRNAELNKHIGFYYEDTDLVEFGIDPNENTINKMVLTLSNHYEFHSAKLEIHNAENCTIKLLYPARVDCSCFKVDVYCDGVKINLSNNKSTKYFRTGQLIIGFNSDDDISEIDISELSEANISFIKRELELG